MRDYKKVIPVCIAHLVFGIAACFIWRFLRPVTADLIEPLVTGFRIRSAILLFIGFFPALFISSMLIGYSLEFSANADDAIGRWSDILFLYIKRAYVLLLVCLSVYIVLSEGFAPGLERRQRQDVSRTVDFRESLDAAADYEAEGLFSEAERFVRFALSSWPGNGDASALLERVQYKKADAPVERVASREKTAEAGVLPDSSAMTPLAALDLARAAEARHDYFNAHYYATLAAKIALPTDPNREEALRLASRAWNAVSAGKDRIDAKENRDLFQIKREGYNAIQNGDFLRAYYIFFDLHEKNLASKEGLTDPDVDRFLEVARRGVLESFFFIDETFDVEQRESSRNVFFVIRHSDGTSAAFSARGLEYTRHAGRDMAYIRGLEYVSFDRNGGILYRMNVPFAKMFPSTAGNRPYQQPELLLRSVDRKNEGVTAGPVVTAGAMPENEKSILVLDMDYRDIGLIVSAGHGVGAMSLPELWSFAPRAGIYGFSRAAIKMEILRRIIDPFLMLIVSVYALILGWKFRLGKNIPFKFWWILAVPFFPVLCFMFMDLVRFLAGLCGFAIVSSFPANPEIPVLAVLSIWFAVASVQFFSQRSD